MENSKETPSSVKFVSFVLKLKVLAFVIISVALILFLQEFSPDSTLAGVKEGALGAFGLSSQTYSSFEMGRIIGRQCFYVLFAFLALYFLKRRKLTGLRIALGMGIVTSLSSGIFIILTALVLFGISFTKSFKDYFVTTSS